MFKNNLLIGVIVCSLLGCSTQKVQYLPPETVIAGSADQYTMYDLETSAQRLMAQLLSNPQFKLNYDAAKTAKGRLPIAVIGNIENKTSERIQGSLAAMGETIRVALFNSGLLDVKEDEASVALASRIIRSEDDLLEDGSLMKRVGTHESPDFLVLGDIRHFKDIGGYHTYRLRLAIHNLHTGKIVWEGIQTMIKL